MSAPTIEKFCIDFKRDNTKVRALDLPVQGILIEKLLWHFAFPFWFDDDVTNPRAVVESPEKYSKHYERAMNSDTSHPIDVLVWNWRYEILDGLHRLLRLYVEGNKTIKIRVVPQEKIPEIMKDR